MVGWNYFDVFGISRNNIKGVKIDLLSVFSHGKFHSNEAFLCFLNMIVERGYFQKYVILSLCRVTWTISLTRHSKSVLSPRDNDHGWGTKNPLNFIIFTPKSIHFWSWEIDIRTSGGLTCRMNYIWWNSCDLWTCH